MNRRQGLLLLAASAGIALVAKARATHPGRTVVYDGRFTAARIYAQRFEAALDCQRDAAELWHEVLDRHVGAEGTLWGVTCAADVLVLADCARREGLFLAPTHSIDRRSGLIFWRIGRRPAAVAGPTAA